MLTTDGDAALKTAMLFCSSADSGPRGAMARPAASGLAAAGNPNGAIASAQQTAAKRRRRFKSERFVITRR